MWKECWLHINSHLKKNNRKSGLLLLICLTFFYAPTLFTQVSTTINVNKIQKLEKKYQGDIQKRFKAWAKLITELKNKPVTVQLEQVNSFFNQFPYQSDKDTRGVDDYWKSPEEFLVDGGGECKDYAIIKYFTLIALGVPTERLRITYVILLTLNQAHMVLSYYPTPESEPLILDNLNNKILKASKRLDLKPVYSFNGDGLWLAKQRNQGSVLIGQPTSLEKWDALLKRMQ